MNEQRYIIATNLAKARMMGTIIQDMMAGDEYGLEVKIYREAYNAISIMADALSSKNEIKG